MLLVLLCLLASFLFFFVVRRHLKKVARAYSDFVAGLEQVVADAPPGSPRVQAALLLLRVCGQGKVTHLLRTLPPELTTDLAAAVDAAIRMDAIGTTEVRRVIILTLSPDSGRGVGPERSGDQLGWHACYWISPSCREGRSGRRR